MVNRECYEAKLDEIGSIKDEEIVVPSNTPVEKCLQEADNLFLWCQDDKDVFIKANADWRIVEDIPIRAGALREATARWMNLRTANTETRRRCRKMSKELVGFRNMLMHEFRYAYRRNADILKCICAIAENMTQSGLIQDLNDLSVLGNRNPKELEAMNFDMTLLDKAALMSAEFADLFATTEADAEMRDAKKIRDQAYTLLKRAVDEVRAFSRYAFWKDKDRVRGYTSDHIRNLKNKAKKNREKRTSDDQ